jgi:hypothetical protein
VLTLHEDGTQEAEEYGHDDSKPNIEKEVPILMVQPGGDVCFIQEFLPEEYTEAIKLQEHFDQLKVQHYSRIPFSLRWLSLLVCYHAIDPPTTAAFEVRIIQDALKGGVLA